MRSLTVKETTFGPTKRESRLERRNLNMSLFLSSIGVKENRKILLCKKSRGGGGDGTDLEQKRSGFGAWQALRKKEWAALKQHDLIRSGSRMGPIWAGPAVDRAYLVGVIDCCTSEIVGWNVSHLCRTEVAVVAVEEVSAESSAGREPRKRSHSDYRHAIGFSIRLPFAGALMRLSSFGRYR